MGVPLTLPLMPSTVCEVNYNLPNAMALIVFWSADRCQHCMVLSSTAGWEQMLGGPCQTAEQQNEYCYESKSWKTFQFSAHMAYNSFIIKI